MDRLFNRLLDWIVRLRSPFYLDWRRWHAERGNPVFTVGGGFWNEQASQRTN